MKYSLSPYSPWYTYACQNPTVFIRSSFFTWDIHAAVTLLSAGWKENSSSQGRQITSLFVYSRNHLLEAEGVAGGVLCRLLALQSARACCLCRRQEARRVALWQCGAVRWMGWHVVSVLQCPGSWLGAGLEHAPGHAAAFHWFSRLLAPVCHSSFSSPGCLRSPCQDSMNETLVITTAWLH